VPEAVPGLTIPDGGSMTQMDGMTP
jgi:hypothetical protein